MAWILRRVEKLCFEHLEMDSTTCSITQNEQRKSIEAKSLTVNRPFQGFFRHLVGGAEILGRARGQAVKTWRTM